MKLEAVMTKYGFVPYPFKWCHFDYKDWEKYPPLDISFEDLQRGVRVAVPVP
jgi:zinc D-Ala-D-Ala dipeptidase